ncbi:hypothetical protein ACH79_11290 [Bradyrhizobium sp. CCBAU 051011]|jgi:hypothetical protein|uniref:hypothetical protein n=1 Tax=Bradyrhizobium sp. CCBAU 051011 TaxID=858422 RepID=UPI0013745BBA|nr:hypothetical protein [Bradyrhizobium sp. CCBAU 051011]QHO73140.1 hypothetical protein ACH79_11290 [Bradyrhizobium sp. CCBAU 051011]
MKFLARDEATLLEKKLRREISEQADPRSVLYYESGNRDYAAAANTIALSIGKFSEATLVFLWCLSGDGWDEPSASTESWRRYRKWRAANNEERRLYQAPGHRFEANEVERLSKTVKFALELGWDALVEAKPGRQLLFLSHDDRLEIYRGFSGGLLVRQLTGLGYWRRADR